MKKAHSPLHSLCQTLLGMAFCIPFLRDIHLTTSYFMRQTASMPKLTAEATQMAKSRAGLGPPGLPGPLVGFHSGFLLLFFCLITLIADSNQVRWDYPSLGLMSTGR